MSSPEWVKDLEAQAGNKPILLVEGNDELQILPYFLNQVSPGWETGFVMLASQKKHWVIRCIKKYHPDWAGIVDRDEWAPDDIDHTLTDTPRVKLLPRFCLENYFCVPAELWLALPPGQRGAIGNDPDRLAAPILAALPGWVTHGAMWRVIHKKRQGLLYESGFPAKLDKGPVPPRDEIRRILESWHEQLDPDLILAEYDQELNEAQQLSSDGQLKYYVHGKKFFREVVVQTLNELFGQQSTKKWQDNFTMTPAIGLQVPADLRDFLTEVVSLLN